jgi:hypothetical protein
MRTIAVYRVEPSACLRARIVAMMNWEVTSNSCHLYVASATDKLPRMAQNPAGTPNAEKPAKKGVSDDLSRGKIDRRVSVAPMMDWTDDRHTSLPISYLQLAT